MRSKCEKCSVRRLLEESLEYERERSKELENKLIALADAKAYSVTRLDHSQYDDNEFYGSSEDDEFIEFDDFGQRVLKKRTKDKH